MADAEISQYLKITSPSSTAVQYTVSSRPAKPRLIVTALKHAFRLVVAFYTLLATIAKLQATFRLGVSPIVEEALDTTLLSNVLRFVIENVQWWILCTTSLITLYLCIRRDYTGTSGLTCQEVRNLMQA